MNVIGIVEHSNDSQIAAPVERKMEKQRDEDIDQKRRPILWIFYIKMKIFLLPILFQFLSSGKELL